MRRNFSLIFILLAVSACTHKTTYFQNRNNVYLKSRNAPPLVVPANLSQADIKNYYVIKPIEGKPGISDVPPGLKLAKSKHASPTGVANNKIKISSINSRPSLLVNQTAKKTWLAVGTSLQHAKISILMADHHNQTFLISPDNVYLVNLDPQTETSTIVFITDKDGKKVTETDSTRLLTVISNGM